MPASERRIFTVVFVCDDGAVRAPIAAALMNASASGRFHALYAAAKAPAPVSSWTRDTLRIAGLPLDRDEPVELARFQRDDAAPLDFAFNLTEPYEKCGDIALPAATPMFAWPIPRPDLDNGSQAERSSRITNTLRMIRRRVELFAELPPGKLDALAMRRHAEQVHRQAGEP